MTEHSSTHTNHSPTHVAPSHSTGGHSPKSSFPLLGVAAVLLVGVIVAYFLFMSPSTTVSPVAETPVLDAVPSTSLSSSSSTTNPDNTVLSKAKYLLQLYTINRDSYGLFEKAAAYRNETVEDTKKFFLSCCDLESEEGIFSELPSIPSDFSTVAYNFATGQIYQLGSITGSYYKQPELYFHATETSLVNRKLAFSGWSEPQLNYWGDYGGTAVPADQYGVVSKKGRPTFTASIFVANGWNIQNWVGMHMVANASSLKNFDIQISEEQTGQPYFLLGPTFPKFSKDWATKITVVGTVKDSTPPGVYQVRVNPIQPPKELSQKWSEDHLGIYVPYGGLVPDTGFITLNITVTE